MIHSRVSWMLRPVLRSMTVSAPQRIDQTILSTSDATSEATAELPMLALILTRKLRPIAIGFGVVDVAGDDRPAARHFVADELGGHVVGDRGTEAFAVALVFGQARAAQ